MGDQWVSEDVLGDAKACTKARVAEREPRTHHPPLAIFALLGFQVCEEAEEGVWAFDFCCPTPPAAAAPLSHPRGSSQVQATTAARCASACELIELGGGRRRRSCRRLTGIARARNAHRPNEHKRRNESRCPTDDAAALYATGLTKRLTPQSINPTNTPPGPATRPVVDRPTGWPPPRACCWASSDQRRQRVASRPAAATMVREHTHHTLTLPCTPLALTPPDSHHQHSRCGWR